jgi:hypothetical protein
MFCTLAFDLCAAGLLDGYNVNEKEKDLQVWAMLLDHGYRVAATAGADFGLDRPNGPVPGHTRMYCYCPDGLTSSALAEAVRHGRTIISTGPVLMADIGGQPPGTTLKAGQAYDIRVQAWARGDEKDHLQRVELWSHGKAIATQTFDGNGHMQTEHKFSWKPQGEWDWAAVRAVSKRGWAMTSAFYAAGPQWQAPQPVQCRLTITVTGLDAKQQETTLVEIWDGVPGLATARKVTAQTLKNGVPFEVPVSASVIVRAPDGRRKDVSLYDAVGMPEVVERIASGAEEDRPMLAWGTYAEVLKRCREARVEVKF